MRRMATRAAAVAMVAAGAVGACASIAAATKPDPTHKITICHATASASNPYVAITVDIASIGLDSGHGRSGVNAGDIIPKFDIDGYSYPGNNWDADHQAILDNGCDARSASTTSTSTTFITITG
jgi:hypothetical protein